MGRTVKLIRTAERLVEPVRIPFNDRKLPADDRLRKIFDHRLIRILWLSFGRGHRVIGLEDWCFGLAAELEKLGYFPEPLELYQLAKRKENELPSQVVINSFEESKAFFVRLAEALRDPLRPITYIES